MFDYRGWHTKHARLMLAIGANLFEGSNLEPQAATASAFAHRRRAECDRQHIALALGTLQSGERGSFRVRGCRAAMRTMAAADEHHGEARRARDGCEL